jgi:chromosome condensin MukBEF complex kleisin-like MukF subunit
MIDRNTDRDAAANLLERRWFSSIAAVRAMQAECEVLRDVMDTAEAAWQRARTQLARLECLRDTLGDQLAALDEQCPEPASKLLYRTVMSAA